MLSSPRICCSSSPTTGSGSLAWLYTTVRREAWAMRRRSSRQRECSLRVEAGQDAGEIDLGEALPADLPGPAERFERGEILTERRRDLSSLKADERRALGLLALGLSYVEICETTGWTYTNELCEVGPIAAVIARPQSRGMSPSRGLVRAG